MVDYLLKSQTKQLEKYISNQKINHIINGQINKFEPNDNINLISFDWLDILNSMQKPDKIIIFHTVKNLFFICEDEETIKRIKSIKIYEQDISANRFLYLFFSQLLKPDLDKMSDLEEQITNTEDAMLENGRYNYTYEIIKFRKELLRLKRYYQQLDQVFDGVLENENRFFSQEDISSFKLLDKRIDRLFSEITNLHDYITQMREAYQAQIDINQNNLMKIFTVITTIFLPLTLIVGWYGMNFKIPEFEWDNGYIYVIVLCVIVVGVLLLFFKKKNWFK